MIENQCPIGRISVKSSLGVKNFRLHKMLPSAFDSIHVTRRRKLVSPADAPSPIPRLSKHQQQQVVKEEKVTPEIDENQENRIVVGPLQKMYGSGESTSHAFPPTLLRIASAPPRTTFNKLRICLRLAKADLSNQLLNFDPASSSAQFTVNNSSKTSSVTSFHQVFAPEVTQQEICSNCLPELLHTVFSGSDASLLYFGGASRLKDELLYSSRPNNYGIFVAALAWTFKLITEFRERKPQFRYSVRISALHYSQKTDQLIDLFEQFNEKVGRPVTVVDDPALGIRVENQTEIRVDSVDKAMFYLDRLIDHRTIEDEESQRGSHVFFYILVYRYKVEGNQVAGGKSRFCLMDLGLGEKHSRNGHITLSAIGNILLAIFQGQKHLPSRQSIFCQLLKESIGNSRNKSSVLLSTLPSNEEDHILQLANKLHKATRSTIRRGKSGSDHSSVASDEKPVRRRTAIDSEQSSSEQSCAETVIFLGPSLKTKEPSPPDPPKHQRKMSDPVQIDFPRCHSAPRTPIHGPALQPIPIDFPPFYKTSSHSLPRNCTFTPPSPLRRTQHDDKFFVISNPMAHEPPAPQPSKHKSADVDPKKNQMIVNWLMHQEPANGSPRRFQGQQEYGHDVGGIGVPLEPKKPSFFGAKFARLATKMDSAIQCNEEDIDSEMLNVWNAARFLDDIVEDEEESLRTSSLMSSTANREALAEKTQDMNILSMNMDQISLQGDEDDMESVEMNDDDLEKAMAASVSSIKSHEILSRMNSKSDMVTNPTTSTSDTHEPTEMDLYRRASHLEAYACERLREMEQEEEQKKRDKKRLAALSKAKFKQLCCQQAPSVASAEGNSSIVDGNVLVFENSEEDNSAATATTSVSAGCSPLMPRPVARFLKGVAPENNNSMVAVTSNDDVKKSPSSPTLKARLKAMWGGSDSGRKLVEVKTPKVPSSKEKWKIKQLNCCQNPSMASSGVSTIPEVSSSIDDHLQGSIPDIPPEIAQQITQQLTNYNLKSKSLRQVVSSDSIASSPHHVKISASCQPSPVRSAALQQTLSVQNIPLESRHHRKSSASAIPKAATTRRKDSVESIRREKKNSASSRVRSKERRSSLESSHASAIPSPYSKVTNAKTVDHGAYSSGHGSDETGSVVHCRPSTSLNANGGIPSSASKRNRESFSASSGYESADYGRYKSKGNFMDAKMGKLPVLNAKSAKTSLASPSINPQLQAAIDHLYALRAHLQAELAAAKRRIGSLDDSSPSRAGDRYLDANPETVLETLSQETRILEKRIAACQSHAMLVTSFL